MTNVINQWRGAKSRSAGLNFEASIVSACDYYKERGLACIDKTPEPIRQIGAKDKYGQFRACYTKAAQPDFKGTLAGGQAVVFEAKATESDRLMIDRVTSWQADALQLHNDLGAETFVLARVQSRIWRIDWGRWIMQVQMGKRKFFNICDLEDMAVEISMHHGIIDFLSADTEDSLF